MKKAKMFIPLLIIIIGVSIVFIDTYNTTLDDLIYEQSSIDNTSPVNSKIAEIENGDIILYLYETKDMRLGYATFKKNNSAFNKYSLCSVENIDLEFFANKKNIVRHYNEQNLDFTYGILVNTEDKIFEYENKEYPIEIFDFKDITFGAFVTDESV